MTTTTDSGSLTGLRINLDGTMEEVSIDGTVTLFQAVSAPIGAGLYDRIGLPSGIDVFVDGEGAYGSEWNPVLSDMVGHALHTRSEYRVYGPGLFLGIDADGDTPLSLTREQRSTLTKSWLLSRPLAAL